MRSRPRVSIERVDVFDADAAAADRYHLAYLRTQLDATQATIDGSRRCIAEALESIAKIDRMIEKSRGGGY